MDIYLAEPRGFCAGVRRAISIVEEALKQYGAPVYVRHEIVHNRHVIEELKQKGVIFIEELSEADLTRPLIFSAHGVGKNIEKEAQNLGLNVIDATCPLVGKVHNQIKKFDFEDMEILVIGKKNHPEIIGTVGQLENSKRVHIITTLDEAQNLNFKPGQKVGFVTQTTLSSDDTKEIMEYLKSKFHDMKGLEKDDICYATNNRQKAIKELAKQTDTIIVLGSKNSSNSKQLKEVALKNGAVQAFLIDDYREFDWNVLNGRSSVGISAGASAPEYLVEELVNQFKIRYNKINIHHVVFIKENVNFKL
ncbi:MAG: 4-hydroxy-3-methylbut-2-enyl diphosphate reductase [Alphaproteobacteria bacterium]